MKSNRLILFPLICVFLFLSSCATLPQNNNSLSLALTKTDNTRIGKAYSKLTKAHPGESGLYLLGDGLDALTARLILSQSADMCIDVQYYMIHDDMTGSLFVEQLVNAADRGVRVRVLIDDMDLEKRDEGLSTFAAHPNINLRVFNPFGRNTLRLFQYISGFGSVTRRMHNKSFTVDNQVTVVGGRNIGNEYFDADPALMFGDLDLMAVGPVVKEVSKSFDEYWNNGRAYPIDTLRPDLVGKKPLEKGRQILADVLDQEPVIAYRQQLLKSTFAQKIEAKIFNFYWGKAQVLSDHPDKLDSYEEIEQYSLAPQFKPFFKNLKNELLIFSPYFVPGKTGTKFLTDLSKKGVKVRIITNSLTSTDVGLVHAGYSKYRKNLLRGGVELYEINKVFSKESREIKKGTSDSSKASLHAKSFVLDRQNVFIGSLNLDPRSVTENTEIGIMVTSDEVAKDMVEIFELVSRQGSFMLKLETDADGFEFIRWTGWKDGKKQTWVNDPYTSFFRRFGIGLISLLPIESQL